MKRAMRGLALALALVMCLAPAPARAEGSMLADRMRAAYEAGRQIEATFGASLGTGLSLFIPAETFDIVQQLLADARIVTRWAKGEAGQPVVELAVTLQGTEIVTGTARPLDSAVALETSLLPGKTLLVPYESLGELAQSAPVAAPADDQAMALYAEAGERYLGIAMEWAQRNGGLLSMSDAPMPATDARSEAASSMQLTVTGAQLKDLLVRLTDEFERDEALQAALERSLQASAQAGLASGDSIADAASELAQGAKGLNPLDGTLTLSAYTDAEGGLVGLDLTMEPLFEGMTQAAFARYDRLDGDGASAHAFQGKLGLDDGGMAATMITHRAEESHLEQKSSSDLLVRGMAQMSAGEPITQITLTDARQTERTEGRERMSDVLELAIETLTPDGSAQLEDSMPIDALIGTQCVTNEESSDDFTSNIAISLQALGMEFAALELAMASDAYTPADTSGNLIIDLATASDGTQAALMNDLQAGLGQAIESVAPLLPPALLQMMGADGPAPPLTKADFALELPGGAYNLATDSREDLERVTGKAFEFYDEFPHLGIAYDRLLTDEVNFFAQRDGGPVDQAHFKQGMVTARGIAHGSTYAQLVAAYGEPSFEFVEHGYARVEYELVAEDGSYSLNTVVNMDADRVTDITLNCHQ